MNAEVLDLAARWLHIAGVIVWMGHNWSNVVHNPVYRGVLPQDPSEAARDLFVAASKREHAIFRHSSLVVLATGLFMLWRRDLLLDAVALDGAAATLGLGMWLATAMALNLWLVMWPHQKKVLGFVPADATERVRCARVTFLSSRLNTVLSLPTLLFMIAGAHGVTII
ncbi:MAG: urate hydroxylase PuuD [Pseudomonadota bacterium]